MAARPALPVAFLALLCAVALAPGAQAQEPPVPLGTRVRVTYERGPATDPRAWRPLFVAEGRLTGWDGTAIGIDAGDGDRRIPLAGTTKLEQSRGRKGHALTGALIGAAAGAAATVGLLIASRDDSEFTTGMALAMGGVAFVLPGVGIGAGIGAAVRTDRWETVPLPERPGSIRPAVAVRIPVGP